MMTRLIDWFHTQDGEWFVSNKPYSISREALERYGNDEIPGRGGANHLFLKSQPGDEVYFNTTDGKNPSRYTVDASGWQVHPLFHSSAFVPARGEVGPWIVSVNGVEIRRGLGLPDGLHVSTYLVVGQEPWQPTTQPVSAEAWLAGLAVVRALVQDLLDKIDELERTL